MLPDRQYVTTDTTDTIRMPVHHTATTVRSGLVAECLSALARGMATVDTGVAVTAGAAAGVTAAEATMDTRAMPGAVMPTTAEALMPAAEVAPTGAVDSTAVVHLTAAGNHSGN